MPEDLDRTYSYGSTKSSSIRTNNATYIQGLAVQKERVSPSTSSNNGKAPTYTLQKAARMTAKVNHKWVRIASVLAYLMAISMTAIVLALYYILFYNPGYSDLVDQQQEEPDFFPVSPAAGSQLDSQYAFRRQLGFSAPPAGYRSLPETVD